jgi:4-amino-4-deoxy-L-arabinose transferase-like glycosyltransferase
VRRLEAKGIRRREQGLVLAAMVLAAVLVLAFVIVRRHHPLAGDAPAYDSEGRFIADGHWWWSTVPYGIAHVSAWKAPIYPALVGIVYAIVGDRHNAMLALQAIVFAPATVALTWWLARRLFGQRAGVAAAFLVAVYPNVWQWFGLVYSEAIAIPLTLLLFIAVLGRTPTARRSVGVGALLGVLLLVRPSSIALAAPIVIAWLAAAGLRRGLTHSLATLLMAIAVVAPWTVRNAVVLHGFLPISLQDAAAYGTFNSQAAHDPDAPYAWRVLPPAAKPLLRRPRSDIALHAALQKLARDYIKDHPFSLVEAFYWNGLTRTWDIRRPRHILDEPHFEGRSRTLSAIGMWMWWPILAGALAGLWRSRRRLNLVLPVVALALATSVVFTSESGTRYRVPIDPLAIVLACGTLLGGAQLASRRGAT